MYIICHVKIIFFQRLNCAVVLKILLFFKYFDFAKSFLLKITVIRDDQPYNNLGFQFLPPIPLPGRGSPKEQCYYLPFVHLYFQIFACWPQYLPRQFASRATMQGKFVI